MSIKTWAKREVELACRHENPNRKDGEFDYRCACYESALEVFNVLCDQGHSGYSIHLTQNFLNRLIDGKPLTPIGDTDDIWTLSYEDADKKEYQCSRMPSFFKTVFLDGTVKYSDVDRVVCYDIRNAGYTNLFITELIDKMCPICMPYTPCDNPFKVYISSFLYDPKNGDYDTFAVKYVINPFGERINIYRYFKEHKKTFIEINSAEYMNRLNKRVDC